MLQAIDIKSLYLSRQISDTDLLEVFEGRRLGEVKSKGAVYTPPEIATYMLDRLGISSTDQTIVEPACGHGAFLLPLIRLAMARFSFSPKAACDWFIRQVRGLEVDAATVTELREILALCFTKMGVTGVRPEDFTNISTVDALFWEPDRPIDFVIGNPPYIRTREMDRHYLATLRAQFPSMAEGNVDIYYAFIEKFAGLAQVGCSMIVPSGCLTTKSAQVLRTRTFGQLAEIVDFRDQLVFEKARTYTAILTFRPSHRGALTRRTSICGSSERLDWTAIARPSIDDAPRIALSGLCTGKNEVFRLFRRPDGRFFGIVDGAEHEVEPDLVRPLVKITKFDVTAGSNRGLGYILFPYRAYATQGVFPEAELQRCYPRTYGYLCAHRAALEARDGGDPTGRPAWYAFGRGQGLHDLAARRVMLVPAMIGGRSLPRALDTTALTEAVGAPLFVSGYVVPADAPGAMELLRPAFLQYVRSKGSPKTGDFHAISAKHVNAFLALASTERNGHRECRRSLSWKETGA